MLDWPHETSVVYAEIRHRLATAGTPIGSNDLLIAAHALSLGCTLVTNNSGEFDRVEGLFTENWNCDNACASTVGS